MLNYDIGGSERKIDVNEGFADIPQNKTLFIQKLTDDPPVEPIIKSDLKTTEEVFEFYKPQKEVEFETEDGASRTEMLHFHTLGDFGKNGIINQSTFLNELNSQCDELQKFLKRIKSNKILRTLLENKEAKENYIATIQAMMKELESAD